MNRGETRPSVDFSDVNGFGIQIPKDPKIYSLSQLNEQLAINSYKNRGPKAASSIDGSEAYRNELKKHRESVQELPTFEIEEIAWDIPKQTDISPITNEGKSMIKNVIITKKALNHKEGPQAEGTLFDPHMGTLVAGAVCATCNMPECAGHSGRILFPVKIPYENFIDVPLLVLSCICTECYTTILNIETIKSLPISKNAKLSVRLTAISNESKKHSCVTPNYERGGICGAKKVYDRESSKESGFFIYTDTVSGIKTRYSGDEVDFIFRKLRPETINILGFDDVEDLCKYLCVGIIVPGIPDRPYIESFDKFKNPDNETLSKIVAANERLKEELQARQHKQIYQTDDTGNFSMRSDKELENEKRNLVMKSERVSTETSSLIARFEETILSAENQLRQDAQIQAAEEFIRNSTALIAEQEKIMSNAAPYLNNPQAVIAYNAATTEITRLQQEVRNAVSYIQNNPIKQQINLLRIEIDNTKRKSEDEASLFSRQIESISKRLSAHSQVASRLKGDDDIMKLISDLYKVHKEYIGIMLKKATGKYESLRRNALGKHAYYVARAVASPGVDLEIGEIEIPEHLTGSLGVTEEVNSLNIVEYKIMLSPPPGKKRTITHIRRNGQDIEVTDLAVQEGQLDLRVGDIVTRHLRDGDAVVAVRMPTIHRNNILAFYAKIIPGALSIRVHMIWTTGYNLDFDGDEISLYIPQGDAVDEVMRTMYAPLNIISPKTGKIIGGVVYNAVSAWYMATKTQVIIRDSVWNDVYTRLKGRDQLPSFYHRLASRGITMKTGHALFSMLLPESFNYPASGDPPVKDVIIESGILVSGTITSAHISPGGIRTIIQSIYHLYGIDVTEKFLNDIYMAAYMFQRDNIQTITAEDCDYGRQIITKLPNVQEYKFARDKIEKMTNNANLSVEEYTDLVMQVEPLTDRDSARNKAEFIAIERRVRALGPILEDRKEDYIKNYTRIVQEIKGVSVAEAKNIVDNFIIERAAEIEGARKLKIAEVKIQLLGPVPKNPLKRRAYESQLVSIVNEIGNVGIDAATEVRKFMDNNLLDMASDFGAGAKGNPGNIAMMGGYVGQQSKKGSARLPPEITGSTRCASTIRPGDTRLQAGGYIDDSYFGGISPINTLFGAIGQREGMADIATKTSTAGLFNRRATKAMENIIVFNGVARSQSGQLYQYIYGEDGFAAEKLIHVNDKPTFVDITSIADKINYDLGWNKVTYSEEAEQTQEVVDKVKQTENLYDKTKDSMVSLEEKLTEIKDLIIQETLIAGLISERDQLKEKLTEVFNNYRDSLADQQNKSYLELAEARNVISSIRKESTKDEDWLRRLREAEQVLIEKMEATKIERVHPLYKYKELESQIEKLEKQINDSFNEAVLESRYQQEYNSLLNAITEENKRLKTAKSKYLDAKKTLEDTREKLIKFPVKVTEKDVDSMSQHDLLFRATNGDNTMRRDWFRKSHDPYVAKPSPMMEKYIESLRQ